MNLILLEESELEGSSARVGGRRASHIALIHRADIGKQLRVGVIGGAIGTGVVGEVSEESVVFHDIVLDALPPPKLACTLLLALPRPPVLRRVLAATAAFGIRRIVIFGARLVEKSYWQSPALGDEAIREELLLGLEQAGDTVLPAVERHRYFRPFVEEEVPRLVDGSTGLIAHPGGGEECPRAGEAVITLAIGAEGGFIDFELEKLEEAGFRQVTLGVRPLRTEHAVAALLGRLF